MKLEEASSSFNKKKCEGLETSLAETKKKLSLVDSECSKYKQMLN